MPASIVSHLSVRGGSGSQFHSSMASNVARDIANREIKLRIQSGRINEFDKDGIAREYKTIYSEEYYKYYAHFVQQDIRPSVIFLQAENPAARKYYVRHTVANFSKLNCFIHVHRGCITVGRYDYPIDDDSSLETKEAFLTAWPGPLDRQDSQLKRKVTDYVDTLWQHDSQRHVRYCNLANDSQRKLILKLLTELLHRNGTIDAPGVTRLLLRPEQTEIQKDEGNRKPLELLQKYLLLGKRSEAIKFAKTRKLWDHAHCLAFLDKYQPPNSANYLMDGSRLRDDSIVQLNDEYIGSIEPGILKTVYRSLLNRILQIDPESVNIIKHPNVGNDSYEYAMLSANDCEMEFDQSNEIFKLILSIKQTIVNPSLPSSHLIALGYTALDAYDPSDDLSYRSHISFVKGDTYFSRTLTISNMDMLILNEIWEYCLNLAKGTCNPNDYEYIIDLVPYKLIFAARLLDFGFHRMFANYLSSIRNALFKSYQKNVERDPFYDWDTIERCVDYLGKIWDLYRESSETFNQQSSPSPKPTPFQPSLGYEPPASYNPVHSMPNTMVQNDYQQSQLGVGNSFSWPLSPINPTDDLPKQEVDLSRRTSAAQYSSTAANEPASSYAEKDWDSYGDNSEALHPRPPSLESPVQSLNNNLYSPPSSYHHLHSHSHQIVSNEFKQSHSPPSEPLASPHSLIDEYDDLPKRDLDLNRRAQPAGSAAPPKSSTNNQYGAGGSGLSGSNDNSSMNNNTNNNKAQPSNDQQSGFFNSLVGSAKALLPKSNSKQMILPEDSKPGIVYDDQRRQWVDTTQPEGAENNDTNDGPPPVMNVSSPPSYSFPVKSSKSRYPKA